MRFLFAVVLFCAVSYSQTFRDVQLTKDKEQASRDVVQYSDSVGTKYFHLVLRMEPDGSFSTSGNINLIIVPSDLTPVQREYIRAQMNAWVLKRKVEQ